MARVSEGSWLHGRVWVGTPGRGRARGGPEEIVPLVESGVSRPPSWPLSPVSAPLPAYHSVPSDGIAVGSRGPRLGRKREGETGLVAPAARACVPSVPKANRRADRH